MSERKSVNPYREPREVEGQLDRGPGVVRLVGYRVAAIVLGLLGLVVLLIAGLSVAYLGLRALSFGLFMTVALGALMLSGARALWYRASLSTEESRDLDALHDRALLAELAGERDWSNVELLAPGDYAERSDRELWEIARRIDPEAAGDRYRQLVTAIRARLRGDDDQPG